MSPRRPTQSDAKGVKSATARSSAVEKVEQAEAERGLKPSKAVGHRLHAGFRENA